MYFFEIGYFMTDFLREDHLPSFHTPPLPPNKLYKIYKAQSLLELYVTYLRINDSTSFAGVLGSLSDLTALNALKKNGSSTQIIHYQSWSFPVG